MNFKTTHIFSPLKNWLNVQLLDAVFYAKNRFDSYFNIFELQKALGEGDTYKANLICRHFAANPKANPFVFTIALLYQFFVKLLLFHSLKDKSKDNIVGSELSINPFFAKDYRQAARRFNNSKTIRAIRLLREYDLKSKGLNNATATDGELLREMIFRIMH